MRAANNALQRTAPLRKSGRVTVSGNPGDDKGTLASVRRQAGPKGSKK